MGSTRQDQDARSKVGFRLLRSVRRIVRRVAVHSKRMSAETGLTVPQLLCMRAIEDLEDDEVTLAAVADAVHLSRSTVSSIVERLVKVGYVQRDRSTRDRRRLHLTLTALGLEKLDAVPSPLQDRFLERVMALEPDRQAQILDALEEVVRLMDAEDIDAAPMLVPGAELRRDG